MAESHAGCRGQHGRREGGGDLQVLVLPCPAGSGTPVRGLPSSQHSKGTAMQRTELKSVPSVLGHRAKEPMESREGWRGWVPPCRRHCLQGLEGGRVPRDPEEPAGLEKELARA